MALPPAVLFEPGKHDHLLPGFAAIHIGCIHTDHTLATFLPPFDCSNPEVQDERITTYWKHRFAQVAARISTIIMQLGPSQTEGQGELVGYVILKSEASETGPFRGGVQKLLVSPRYRKQGVAKKLMAKLEQVARDRGTTLLSLDTEVGSPAEQVYPKLGWTRIGVIKRYGISPKDGRLVDEVYFYKDLNEAQ